MLADVARDRVQILHDLIKKLVKNIDYSEEIALLDAHFLCKGIIVRPVNGTDDLECWMPCSLIGSEKPFENLHGLSAGEVHCMSYVYVYDNIGRRFYALKSRRRRCGYSDSPSEWTNYDAVHHI